MDRLLKIGVFLASSIFVSPAFCAPGDLLHIDENPVIQTAQQIDAGKVQHLHGQTGTPSKNGVVFYKITYETTDLSGHQTRATGMLMVPDSSAGAGPFPLVSYQHMTTMTRTLIPSNLASGMAFPPAFLFAAQGYVVAAADYLGLGDSPGIHPYIHAQTEASATADMLRAIRKAAQKLGFSLSPQLFLTGYSQGGHATMALHRYLEQSLSSEFTVTASAPGAGPYDISHSTLPALLRESVPASVAELCYVIQSMGTAYGINSALELEVVPSAWRKISSLFDGSLIEGNSPSEAGTILNGLLPITTPTDLFEPNTLQEFRSGVRNAFVQALAQNDVYEWVPKAPVRLYYSAGDKEVPIENSIVAYNYMQKRGSNVQLIKTSDSMDHVAAMIPTLKQAAEWFETLRSK